MAPSSVTTSPADWKLLSGHVPPLHGSANSKQGVTGLSHLIWPSVSSVKWVLMDRSARGSSELTRNFFIVPMMEKFHVIAISKTNGIVPLTCDPAHAESRDPAESMSSPSHQGRGPTMFHPNYKQPFRDNIYISQDGNRLRWPVLPESKVQ
ncbi:uncharacterized protein [Globicephala melas]|uniref:uncharacterized protein isoform X2 n=1 Tax=Globicephala melas TaxID=9731 RepID=UPI0038739E52